MIFLVQKTSAGNLWHKERKGMKIDTLEELIQFIKNVKNPIIIDVEEWTYDPKKHNASIEIYDEYRE